MIKLIKFFAILLIILIAGHVATRVFADVPYLAALVVPSLLVCIGCAVLLLLFVVVFVISESKGKK